MKLRKRNTMVIPLFQNNLSTPKRQSVIAYKSYKSDSSQNERTRTNPKELHHKPIEDLLIEELKKPRTYGNTPSHSIIIDFQSLSRCSTLSPKRSIELIVYLLDQFTSFSPFIRFNSLAPSDLQKMASFLEYKHCAKDTFIYQSSQQTGKFFGIIKGKVIMIKPKEKQSNSYEENKGIYESILNQYMSNDNRSKYKTSLSGHSMRLDNNNNNINHIQLEDKILLPGMCFGEWSIIRNTPHVESTYCLEDTHLFYLSKEHFNQVLNKLICKASFLSRQFLHKCIPILTDDHLLQLKPEFYEKGTLIYTKYTKARHAFVIYQGECSLKQDHGIQSINELYEKKDKLPTIITITKGGIAGLESSNYNSRYDNTLEVTKNFTVIYRLDVRKLDMEIQLSDFLVNLKLTKKIYMPTITFTPLNYKFKSKITAASKCEEEDKGEEVAQKVKIIIDESHKKVDSNKFKSLMTKINLSRIKSFTTPSYENKKVKSRRNALSRVSKKNVIEDMMTVGPFSSKTNYDNSEEQMLSYTINPYLRTYTSVNDLKYNSPCRKIRQFSHDDNTYRNTIKLIKKEKKMKKVYVDKLIIKTITETLKKCTNKTIYNSGTLDIPLIHSFNK